MQQSKKSFQMPNNKLTGATNLARFLAVFTLMSFILIGPVTLGQNPFKTTANAFQCETTRQEFKDNELQDLLPSIDIAQAQIFDAKDILSQIVGGPRTEGEGETEGEEAPPEEEMEASTLIEISLDGGPSVMVDLNPNPDIFGAYNGEVLSTESSFVALTALSNFGGVINRENRLAGFIILDTVLEKGNTNPLNNWYILEPIRPLLKNVLDTRPSETSCNLDDIYPEDAVWTIVYEARNTNFNINLDPYGADEPATENHIEPVSDGKLIGAGFFKLAHQGAPKTCEETTCEVDLVIVVDQQFVDLRGSEEEADADVVTLMNLLGSSTNNFYSFFDTKVNLRHFQQGDIWQDRFTEAPNAYQLLCDYIQQNNHLHATGNPIISHLFTGYDLANFPDSDKDSKLHISDYGDDFCMDVCGGKGRTIVGLAEGIGGFGDRGTSLNSLCNTSALVPIIPFGSPGHHSLSQHRAKLDVNGETSEFDGNLLQRWVLVTHEIGHNLGARHVNTDNTIKSVMNSTINGKLNFFLESQNASEINLTTNPR